jgi:hypothetical protein
VTFIRALVMAMLLPLPAWASAAPVVASAAIRIRIVSPVSCEVTMALRIEGATEIEHRIEAFEGSEVTLDAVRGGRIAAAARQVGETQSLVVAVDGPDYELRYHARQPAAREGRCPLWLPTVPTAGKLGAVRLEVQLPDGSVAGTSMPAFAWSGTTGTAATSHVPAFVRVSYASNGESPGWDLLGVMDAVTVAAFVAASGVWIWRQRRLRWA